MGNQSNSTSLTILGTSILAPLRALPLPHHRPLCRSLGLSESLLLQLEKLPFSDFPELG